MVGPTCGPAAGGRHCASLSLLRLWKAEYYLAARRPALAVRGVDAFEPVANLPRSSLAALGGAQDRQTLLLQSPSAGHLERPRQAPGCLLIRSAAQQLLGKVGLLHTAAATDAEQRAASATAAHKRGRAAPGRTGPSTRSAPPGHIRRSSYIFPGRSMNYYGTRRRGHDFAFPSFLRTFWPQRER